jgi:hypothetical protein
MFGGSCGATTDRSLRLHVAVFRIDHLILRFISYVNIRKCAGFVVGRLERRGSWNSNAPTMRSMAHVAMLATGHQGWQLDTRIQGVGATVVLIWNLNFES